MNNRLVRNIPVVLWWIAILFTLMAFPWLVFVGAAILLAAAPFSRKILNVSDVRPLPLSALDKFVELGNMTALSAVKAMVYSGKLPGATKHKMLDKSKEEPTCQ